VKFFEQLIVGAASLDSTTSVTPEPSHAPTLRLAVSALVSGETNVPSAPPKAIRATKSASTIFSELRTAGLSKDLMRGWCEDERAVGALIDSTADLDGLFESSLRGWAFRLLKTQLRLRVSVGFSPTFPNFKEIASCKQLACQD
jgi:hypothetical protein